MPKVSIRQTILAMRKALGAAEKKSMSLLIQRALIGTSEFAAARVIGLYAPVYNEVETAEVMREALSSGKTVLFPAVCSGGLEFRKIADPSELSKGAFGIPEPCPLCPVLAPDEADLVVVPGVAFDIDGRRIGYGKGYYDRTLHHLEGNGRLVGLCYDFQVTQEIPGEPHDVRMDMIITERRVIRPPD